MGFQHVSTYIQSGNVIFDSPKTQKGILATRIEKAIKDQFGYPVQILIIEKAELAKIIKNNPFMHSSRVEPDKLHVTFLTDKPTKKQLLEIENIKTGKDQFQMSGKEIYLYCPDGYGRTKLTNNFLKKACGACYDA